VQGGQVKLKVQDFRDKPKFYYLINQLHVSATVGSHHQEDQNNVKERINMSAFAILIGNFGQYKCDIESI
jgi:hypothetical protein